ncbi:alginate lyase family protein [Negadavirga shengliensis]|uniref:Alginate lyase family protein n=1 Tax=Negadavirga shengliensis TaxID=1389218 RepID=A0ABV9T853_9BACT
MKFTKSLLLLGILFSISESTVAQKTWKEIITIEDLYAHYPATIEDMFNDFNLDHPGFEKVKAAKERGDMVEASGYLLEYYKNSPVAQDLRKTNLAITDKTEAEADTILNNVFVVQNVRGQVPYGDDGHRDWYYKGPNNDREWAWLSNRHSQLSQVFSTYFDTGNPKYVQYIDLFLRDFIIKSMPYPAQKSSTSVWRGLEVAARAKVWTRIFYGLIDNEYFSPATRLLILSSLPDHAHYNRNFHGGNNWLTMEISALATIAANFPEYTKSSEWLDYAIGAMTESMKDQVYADGVQTELTSHYHNVSLHNFELFKEICDKANKTLPDFYTQTIEDMYSYIAHAVRPSGFRILNNDGDRGSDRNLILSGAEKFNKTEWEYIASNGNSGTQPLAGPSYFFPWAGQMISRSGFDADAHWSFFDMGPWGSGHQHNDKLHISISAYGKDFLVDAGRFAYTGEVAEKFRPYARGSQGHNVILIDQMGQNAGPTHAEEPLGDTFYKITDDFDYASNSFDRFIDVEGEAKHIRSVFYVRGEFWVVVDKVLTDKPRKIDALWHWHPECIVEQDGLIVKTNHERGNLAVIPLGGHKFEIAFVKGQETPDIQGWYSPEYNLFEPNIASIYSTEIKENTTFVWLLLPSDAQMSPVSAEILSENDKEVQIDVKSDKEGWRIHIPFMNSKDAKLTRH